MNRILRFSCVLLIALAVSAAGCNKDDKNKGKGKGKKGKGSGTQCKSETPDGKKICFRFNDAARGCTTAKCQFLHVCGKCFKDHPLFRCSS